MNGIAEKVLARCDELVFSYIWRAFTYLACVNKNREAILHQIDKLRVPLNENSVRFKYVLVIGRNAEKIIQKNEEQCLQKSLIMIFV